MSTARAQKLLLARLTAADVALCSLHLDLEARVPEAQGVDALGRSVLLIPSPALRQAPDAQEIIHLVLEHLAAGEVPDGVVSIAYQPAMSAALATILYAPHIEEVLVDGGRGSGKTQGMFGAMIALADAHARAGEALPFIVMGIHDTLTSATFKTGPSLLEPHWHGTWALKDNGTRAVFALAGVEMIHVHIVPSDDQVGGERARAASHMLWAEEAVPSLHDAGLSQRLYELARSSLGRRPTPRPLSVVSTNPGAPESWLYRRFIDPGSPRRARCQVVPADRLTPAEDAAQVAGFGDVDLRRRLGLSEWVATTRGQAVAPNYNPDTHVAREPLVVEPYAETWMAWDSSPGAHCHCTIVAQRVRGEVRIFAALVTQESGLAQHLEQTVLPWVSRRMPWLLTRTGGATPTSRLLHAHDPNMTVAEGGDIGQSGVGRVRRALGGVFYEGATAWAPRIGALLDLLNRGSGTGTMSVQIDPGEDCRLLCRALAGEAYYPMTQAGTVARDNQEKNNHPWEDVVDTACYLAGAMAPALDKFQRHGGQSNPPPKPTVRTHYDIFSRGGPRR